MNNPETYDCAIVGGGLGGLCLSIQLAKAGHSVVLFEKEKYPFHKVCGEYISNESRNFLTRLGIDFNNLDLPQITHLELSTPSGFRLETTLPLGGFGISRYILDHKLAELAREAGVHVKEETKVERIDFSSEQFYIEADGHSYQAKMAVGSFGKRSNLDVKWNRPFISKAKNSLNNYIAVKYHIHTEIPYNTISLHNFENGYCGMSRIEDGKACLCYLTSADNLKRSENSIGKMEEKILGINPFLKKIFASSEKIYTSPLTISQISFDKKSCFENHVLMLGDAAGMITPLCGNGMSMAMHGSKIAAEEISLFFKGDSDREKLERAYTKKWNAAFSGRLKMGRTIQRFFGKSSTTEIFIKTMSKMPWLTRTVIRSTHGKPF